MYCQKILISVKINHINLKNISLICHFISYHIIIIFPFICGIIATCLVMKLENIHIEKHKSENLNISVFYK